MRKNARSGRSVLRLVPIVVAVALAATGFLILRRTGGSPGRSDATSAPAPALVPFKRNIPYDDAQPILDVLREKLPTELQGKTPAQIESAWPGWVTRHDTEIRARLQRGDEESIVNFWFYSTSFTTLPRATERDIAALGGGASAAELLRGRLDDLVAGLASLSGNERLRFARQVIERSGIDPTTSAGQDQARRFLVDARTRVLAEEDRYRRVVQSARRLNDSEAEQTVYATVYRDRGLSSDTSIPVDFAVERALDTIKSKKRLDAGSVRRVGIVGPGLDFTDKAEGYDFYPLQTIQPFALVDSLMRLGLARPDDLRIVTFDLSPRVNQHIEEARQRAVAGDAYVLQLPLSAETPWHPDLVKYWQRFGDRIAEPVEAMAAPAGAASVRVRAVRVRPAVVKAITPRDVNIVLERLDPLPDEERFDLIVATNILVYYDVFDQALALANVSKMLRPGGFLLTNYAVSPSASMEASVDLTTPVFWDRRNNGDTLFWYQRR